ncbi:MAG: glycosyltransferase family 39 protein [Anaerolineaceae bacterium]|nr:glycosyltransferase family 39 protein [Anaerolineaceae bacterium]
MSLPYWLSASLAPLPGLLLVFAGLGIPWALVILPRDAWASRTSVIALAAAFGPLLLTLWMLPLGMVGSLQMEPVLAGVLTLTIVGLVLAWRKRRQPVPVGTGPAPLTGLEKLLLALIVLSLLPRLYSIAWWPFTAYDALWVYGYEGRLYTLSGAIPASIGYYPQFLPLQFTWAQLLAGGVDDHAARATLFFTHLGCALAVYLAGMRLFSRRVGIIAAALWTLYPHSGEWARFGDLEIVLTMLFTLAATFFLQAWTAERHRQRHAIIAGLLLGTALWTKPTAGAFILGLALMLAIELWRVRGDWRAFRPRFRVALLTGFACLPHGAIWYLRNLALGHNAIDFPDALWLERAARSGAEFGWPLLALACLLLALGRAPFTSRRRARPLIVALATLTAALLPTLIGQWRLEGLAAVAPARRLVAHEWALLAAGTLSLWRALRPLLPESGPLRAEIATCAWAMILALPWFVTWLWSYSYHYRLSFAIVPLLILPCALALHHWLDPTRLRYWSAGTRMLAPLALCCLALPGIFSTLNDSAIGFEWLQAGRYPDDSAKLASGNRALLELVVRLRQLQRDYPEDEMVVAAPGVRRLPFFFPHSDIRVAANPTRLRDLDDVDLFVDGVPENPLQWNANAPGSNQVQGALALAGSRLDNVMRREGFSDDGDFRYQVYAVNADLRFQPTPADRDPREAVVFGDFARFRGHALDDVLLRPGRELTLALFWESMNRATQDYSIFVHLRDGEGNLIANWDGPVGLDAAGRYYSTLLWEPGEFIRDERLLRIPANVDFSAVEDPGLWIGIYDWRDGERQALTIEGRPAGDSQLLDRRLIVQVDPPPSPGGQGVTAAAGPRPATDDIPGW